MNRSHLQLLENEPPIVVENILKAALEHAEPDERTPIVEFMLRLRRPRALAAVIKNLHHLDKQIHQNVCAEDENLIVEAAKVLVEEATSTTAENLLDIAEHRYSWKFLPVLVRLLKIKDTLSNTRTAGVFLTLVNGIMGDAGRCPPSHPAADAMDHALAQAGRHFRSHRQDDVLLALALIAYSPGPRVAEMLDDSDHPATLALRGIVEKVKKPLVRRNLIRWLPHPLLGRQCLRWVHRLESAEEFTDFFSHGHLLRTPSRRYALRRIDRPLRCLPVMTISVQLSESAQASLPHLINAVGLSSSMRIKRLTDCIALQSPLGRLRAVQALAGLSHQSAVQALLPYTQDAEPAVARIAADALLSQPLEKEKLEHLARNGHRKVMHQARLRWSGDSSAAYFSCWLHFSSAERWTLARHLLATKQTSFLAALKHQLQNGDRSRQLAAIALARRLGIIRDLEALMMTLADGEDAHVVSASIAALGRGRTPHSSQSVKLLHRFMQEGKGRCRANAVEVLLQPGDPAALSAAEPLTEHHDNRLRANAIRGIMTHRPQPGAEYLSNMLRDADPLHRISGLWVARRTANPVMVKDVNRLAHHDDSSIVRARARTLSRILEGSPSHTHTTAVTTESVREGL